MIVVIFISCLEGKFVKNTSGVIERCGEGKHTFASGMVYSGKWEKDKMNGKGRHCSFCSCIECNACTCTSADLCQLNTIMNRILLCGLECAF